MSAKPPILVLHTTGTNRDREAAWACELAGGAPEIVHINRLISGERRLSDYRMLVLPGGFSYGDDLGAGKLWAVTLRYRMGQALEAFISAGRPVLGICNGFQALVKAGLLPGDDVSHMPWRAVPGLRGAGFAPGQSHPPHEIASAQTTGLAMTTLGRFSVQPVTLTRNDSARFECRWVYLAPQEDSPCVFTRGLAEPIYCPVAHGEGKFVARDAAILAAVEDAGLVALRYADAKDLTADLTGLGDLSGLHRVSYPWNPNGSQNAIAGICNKQGNVLGLMPHPEDHIIPEQHPGYHRGERGLMGLPLFRSGIRYASEVSGTC